MLPSKLEWAWDYNFANLNKNWDQLRTLEGWNGKGWNIEEGSKWNYLQLVRYKREIEKNIKSAALQDLIISFLEALNEDEIEEYVGKDNYENFLNNFNKDLIIKPADISKFDEISFIKYSRISDNEKLLELIKIDIIDDIDLNPDSSRYLGLKEERIDINQIIPRLLKLAVSNEEDIIDFFRNDFYSDDIEPVKIIDKFHIVQGTGFSKKDAYSYPGNIPVYTAATDGPAYFVRDDIPRKVKVKGPSLIWSRKGAKAGTIQIFNQEAEFYISDVSGIIKPKFENNSCNLDFLKLYIAGRVKRELQSKSNNAQLNKSKLENLIIYLPVGQDTIAEIIKQKLNS